MSRSPRTPKYRHYKPKNLAVVRIDNKDHYLGKYDSPESHEKYHRLIAEWLSRTQATASQLGSGPLESTSEQAETGFSIGQLIVAYWGFAQGYYVKDSKPTKEVDSIREALAPLRDLYASTSASDFGPKSLQAIRQHMIDVQKLSRKVINQRIGRIKRAFKWAVAEELVPPSLFHGLQAVGGLRYGRTEARETEPVKPAPEEHVDAVLPFVSPHISTMIQVQRLTGMRPCEVVAMRPCDIDTSGEVWVYEPPDHKNRWRGKSRAIPIGPKAQELLRPFMDRDSSAYLFSPKEAEAWRNEQRQLAAGTSRKTPVYPSELRSKEKAKQARKRRKPVRPRRDHYDTHSYQGAIDYGFDRAKKAGVEIPHWHPNQLRHNRGTEVRKVYGVEAAQVILGHARADVTQVYAEKNQELAMKIAKETG